jgi:hypothetical protein
VSPVERTPSGTRLRFDHVFAAGESPAGYALSDALAAARLAATSSGGSASVVVLTASLHSAAGALLRGEPSSVFAALARDVLASGAAGLTLTALALDAPATSLTDLLLPPARRSRAPRLGLAAVERDEGDGRTYVADAVAVRLGGPADVGRVVDVLAGRLNSMATSGTGFEAAHSVLVLDADGGGRLALVFATADAAGGAAAGLLAALSTGGAPAGAGGGLTAVAADVLLAGRAGAVLLAVAVA